MLKLTDKEEEKIGDAMVKMERKQKWETFQNAVISLERESCPVWDSKQPEAARPQESWKAERKLPAGSSKQSIERQLSASFVVVLIPLLKSSLCIIVNGICSK